MLETKLAVVVPPHYTHDYRDTFCDYRWSVPKELISLQKSNNRINEKKEQKS